MQGVCANCKDSGDCAEIHNKNIVERILKEILKDKAQQEVSVRAIIHQKQDVCSPGSRDTEGAWCAVLREAENKGWSNTEGLWSCSA